MYVKINVLYVHCTAYIVQRTLYSVHCTAYIVQRTLYSVQRIRYTKYSEYTTRFTHSIQFMCILYNLYCIVHIDYIYILQILSYTLILYFIIYTECV